MHYMAQNKFHFDFFLFPITTITKFDSSQNVIIHIIRTTDSRNSKLELKPGWNSIHRNFRTTKIYSLKITFWQQICKRSWWLIPSNNNNNNNNHKSLTRATLWLTKTVSVLFMEVSPFFLEELERYLQSTVVDFEKKHTMDWSYGNANVIPVNKFDYDYLHWQLIFIELI